MLKLLIAYAFIVSTSGNVLTGNFQVCNLHCSNEGTADPVEPKTPFSSSETMIRGKSGPRGEKGERGHHGAKGEPGINCNVSDIQQLQQQFSTLQSEFNSLKQVQLQERSEMESILARSLRPHNCSQIKEQYPGAESGEYTIYENNWNGKPVLCDMTGEGKFLIPTNCKEIQHFRPLAPDGVYQISINASTTADVFCDMAGGGWTIFQRRFDGSTDFRQNFQTYSDGFGDAHNEYWLGLENLHKMTSSGRWQLKIDLVAYDGEESYEQYMDFQIGQSIGYRLNVGNYIGTAGDSLTRHRGPNLVPKIKTKMETVVNIAHWNELVPGGLKIAVLLT